MPNTPVLGLPYPTSADTADVPRDIQALANSLDAQPSFLPVGAVFLWALAALPAGLLPNGRTAFVFCTGQTVSAGDYPKLAALLGAPGGNVQIPDLRDRVPMGASAARPVGTPGGEAAHTITVNELPSHNHPDSIAYGSGGAHSHAAGMAGFSYLLADDVDTISVGGSAMVTSNAPHQLLTERLTAPTIRATPNTIAVAAHTHAKSGGVLNAGGGAAMPVNPLHLALNYVMRAA